MGYSFDKAKGIYRTARGKEIPYGYVRGAVDSVADDTKDRLLKLSQSFIDKKISLASWASESESLIRKSLIASGQIGAGGRNLMDAKANGRLGQRVRFHLEKWRGFVLEVERGELSDLELLSRVSMYADAGVNVFETIRQGVMIDAGYTEAKNILGDAKHCSECPAISALGWIPISEMKPVGSRACLSRDRCRVEYR